MIAITSRENSPERIYYEKTLKSAFIAKYPVLTGYLVLGFGFGIILKANGYSILLALASIFIYAGSMQYVAIGLLSGGASLITTLLTTLMVNARHLFYGISMLDKYKNTGKKKLYLIFALTDETYSLVCNDNPNVPPKNRNNYYLLTSAFVSKIILDMKTPPRNFRSRRCDFVTKNIQQIVDRL